MTQKFAPELAARAGVTRATGGHLNGVSVYRIPCPAHGGADPNLAIWDAHDGSLGARCHSHGCSYADILRALGVEFTVRVEYAKRDGTKKRAVRAPNKDFSGSTGSPDGAYVGILNDKPGAVVVLVEGEKACAAVSNAGVEPYVGASWPSGAGSVDVIDFSPLRDRVVVLWPDNDEEGAKAMERAGARVYGAGASTVYIVDVAQLPHKADAADVSREQMESLLAAASIVDDSNAERADSIVIRHSDTPPLDAEGLAILLEDTALDIAINASDDAFMIRSRDDSQIVLNRHGIRAYPDGYGELTDAVSARLRHIASRKYRTARGLPLRWSKEQWREACLALASDRRRDPVPWYLNQLEWDGEPRVERLFIDALCVEDTPLTREYARVFTVGAVARAFDPGCRVELVPVLVGEQGVGKSTFCRMLVPDAWRSEWYSDSLDLGDDSQKKIEQVGSAWIAELAEMTGTSSLKWEAIKKWVVITVDRYRRPYMSQPLPYPRRFVLIGTTNNADVLPHDPGGQRRWMMMRVGASTPEHVTEWMEHNREQIWAEAVHKYRHGERPFMTHELELLQKHANTQYNREDDELEDAYATLTVEGHEPVALIPLLVELQLAESRDAARKDKRTQKRMAAILTREGWTKRVIGRGHARYTAWSPPTTRPHMLVQEENSELRMPPCYQCGSSEHERQTVGGRTFCTNGVACMERKHVAT